MATRPIRNQRGPRGRVAELPIMGTTLYNAEGLKEGRMGGTDLRMEGRKEEYTQEQLL